MGNLKLTHNDTLTNNLNFYEYSFMSETNSYMMITLAVNSQKYNRVINTDTHFLFN